MAQLKSTKVFGDLNVTGEVNASTKITVNGKEVWDTGNLLNIGTTAATARTALGLGAGATRWPTFDEVTGKPATYAPSTHTHTTSQVTGLDTALAAKANTSTQVISGTGLSGGGSLAANRTLTVNYGTAAGTAAQGNDSRIVTAVPNSRTITAGTGLTGGGDFTANRALAVTYGTAAGTAAQGNDSRITGAFQASQVVQATGTSTTSVMSQKVTTDQLATKAASSHTHPWAQVTGQPVTATRWPTFDEVSGKPSTFTATSHTHPVSQVTGLENVDNTRDVNKKVGSFVIHDTRGVVSVPNNVPNSTGLFEFKNLASVGSPPKPSSGTFAHVLTTNGWTADGTGGWPTQVSLGDALSFRKGTSATGWGPWRELISTDTTLGATGQSSLYPMTQKATTDALNTKAASSHTHDYLPLAGGELTGSLSVTGDIVATGNVTAYSDIKLKENIELIPDALAKISTLHGYTYNRKDIKDSARHTGVIAQEVQKVLPEAVMVDEDGTLSVAYGNMVGLLIEAIKELKAEVNELKGVK